MSNQITITAILDEEDGTPVFEVKDGMGNETNALTMKDAGEIAAAWITPALSLENIAKAWIMRHGTNVFGNMVVAVEREFNGGRVLSEDQRDSLMNMIEYSKVEISFPFGHGTPPNNL